MLSGEFTRWAKKKIEKKMRRSCGFATYPSPSLFKLRDLTFQLHCHLHSHSFRFWEGYNTDHFRMTHQGAACSCSIKKNCCHFDEKRTNGGSSSRYTKKIGRIYA